MANIGFIASVADLPQGNTGDFSPLPDGWYTATVAGAELKQTKAGTGSYISVRYDITGPTHQGRVVFGNLNISNPNPKAEEIGRQQLGDLMRAIGLDTVQDTDQLIGGQCQIKLTIRKSEEYGDSNEVKAWKAIEGSKMPSPGSAPATAPQASAGSVPPWAKK